MSKEIATRVAHWLRSRTMLRPQGPSPFRLVVASIQRHDTSRLTKGVLQERLYIIGEMPPLQNRLRGVCYRTDHSDDGWHLLAWCRLKRRCVELQEASSLRHPFHLALSVGVGELGCRTEPKARRYHRIPMTITELGPPASDINQPRRSTMNQADIVVFRRWRENGDMIALFPELPADLYGDYCDAYEHVGQHGGADYHGVVQHTKPCSLEDAADLATELTKNRLHPETDSASKPSPSRQSTATGSGPSQHGVNQPPLRRKNHDRNHSPPFQFGGVLVIDPSGPGGY